MQATADLYMSEYRAAALHWFYSQRKDLGSFFWICTLLERDPAKMLDELDETPLKPGFQTLLEKYCVNRNREAIRRLVRKSVAEYSNNHPANDTPAETQN